MKNKLFMIMLAAMCLVTFAGCKKESPKVESVELNEQTLSLSPGETFTLTVKVNPHNAVYDTVKWGSSDESTVTVDDNGLVTAIAEGKAVVTASIGEITASCEVNVGPLLPQSVTLDKQNLTLKKDQTAQLVATVAPQGAKYELEWSSSAPSVVTVDNDGKVTAVDFGNAVITVKAGEVSAQCSVEVVKTAVESVELDKHDAEVIIGSTIQLNAVVTPSDATDKTLSWSSSDDKVATVSDAGLVTGVAEGTADITVRCGDKSDVCRVSVKIIPVESITLSKTSVTLVEGEICQLTATVNPSDATYKDVVWASDNESVATVDASGTVTAVAGGEAVIKAACGDVFAECIVTVETLAEVKPDWEMYEFFDVQGYGQGVVVEVGTGYIKVLSAQKASLQWAVDTEILTDYYGSKQDKDGRTGSEYLANAEKNNPGNFPAYAWCASLGRGWYMPALGEIMDIIGSSQKRSSINAAFTAAGISTKVTSSEYVWSNGESEFAPEYEAYLYNCVRDKIGVESKDVEHTVFAILRIDF